MKIEIRAARAEDAETACDVMRRSILECCVDDHHHDQTLLAAWLGNKTPEMVRTWFDASPNICMVATHDDVVQGVAAMSRAGKICVVYIAPESRFQGMGSALIAALEARALELGVRNLHAASTSNARTFFARHGFIEAGTVETPYGLQAISFSKQLPLSAVRRCPCGAAAA
ncbi:L-amino acid N-acyltransferase YncA [Noviherbaspirillum humi]|uniref:L-amino acid N-acyltransferase YncA n=1 Tax=Noviherbaspirillum humi TaxID=1688639 RepID=A0A239GJF8_9BURK|nr:GNAT family N-acetyltransferase [Noviherbaspirillum humi]SNS69270.1 L-amino acid N-acyltransferase YncA [Noviherbaspirillum humi]